MNRYTPEHSRAVLLVALCLFVAGCAGRSTEVTSPSSLCRRETPAPSCRSVGEVEAWLARPDLIILEAENTSRGKQRARILTLLVPSEGIVFRAKWRAWWTTSKHNRPRRELAAHAVQRLFLLPHEYIVPPAAGHCFPLTDYRENVEPDAQPTFRATRCVYGILSYWIEDAISAKDAMRGGRIPALIHEELFWSNATYRRSIAHVNLLAHLISHGDSHKNQFVLASTPAGPYIHLVDNSLAFSAYRNPTIEPKDDFSILHVPALPHDAVERLRRADVDELFVIEQYRVRADGMLVHARRGPVTHHPDHGVRRRGDELQVGLTGGELVGVRRRAAAVVARASAGDILLFD